MSLTFTTLFLNITWSLTNVSVKKKLENILELGYGMKKNLDSLRAVIELLARNTKIELMFEKIIVASLNSLSSGGKLFFAGNGGSAAEAQHIAAEFVGRFQLERPAYPAIALTTDTSVITSISNDYSFEDIFSRQIEAFVNEKDIVFLLSTSGNSQNLIKAGISANNIGATCVGMLGNDGGKLNAHCDMSIVVPSDSTARIQEVHLCLLHSMCEILEVKLQD